MVKHFFPFISCRFSDRIKYRGNDVGNAKESQNTARRDFRQKNGRPFWGSRFYVAAKMPFAGSVAFVVRAFMPDTDE
jgi:hypothetical protein